MTYFPVVAIIGARQVGKTTLAKTEYPDFMCVDLEKSSDYDRVQNNIPSILFLMRRNYESTYLNRDIARLSWDDNSVHWQNLSQNIPYPLGLWLINLIA